MAKVFCKSGARDMSATCEWARQSEAGDYLITYESSGLSNDEDPGSRCGYDDAEHSEIEGILNDRGLTLRTDDVGLIVAERAQD